MKCGIANPYNIPLPAHVGVSGGRTSGFLARQIQLAMGDSPDIHYIFTNTGYEHPKTIEFLRRMRDDWGLPIVALEYDHPCDGSGPASGMTVNKVTLESVSLDGTPFLKHLEAIKAYRSAHHVCPSCDGAGVIEDDNQFMLFQVKCGDCGGTGDIKKLSILPNDAQRTCTAYLKVKVTQLYLKTEGLDLTFVPGLRKDEMRRVVKARARGDVCPLADAGVTKPMILEWWKSQPFDLEIPDIRGNCSGCFLKRDAKLLYLAHYYPEDLTAWAKMEQNYNDTFRENRPTYEMLMRRGAAATDEQADAWIAPSSQESLFGVSEDTMPCNCTD